MTFVGANITVSDMVLGDIVSNFVSASDGWANFSLDPGNYSADVGWASLYTGRTLLDLRSRDSFVQQIWMQPPAAKEDSKNIFLWDTMDIPPHHLGIVKFGSPDQYSLLCKFRSDRPVTYFTVEGHYINELLNWTKKGKEGDEMMDPDGGGIVLRAYGGGGGILTWADPTYVVFMNEGNDTARVSYELRYEYGEFTDLGVEIIPLGSAGGENGKTELYFLFPILFIILLFAILITFIIFFMQNRSEARSKERERIPPGPLHDRKAVRGSEPLQGQVRSRISYRGATSRSNPGDRSR
jgi:hypothetical protein